MIKRNHPLATACRQRGVIRGSITSIQEWVTEFKALAEAADLSNVDRLTIQHLLQKLEKSDASFKEFHFGVLDLIDEAEQEDEQAILNEHDDKSLMSQLIFSNSQLRYQNLSPSYQIQI